MALYLLVSRKTKTKISPYLLLCFILQVTLPNHFLVPCIYILNLSYFFLNSRHMSPPLSSLCRPWSGNIFLLVWVLASLTTPYLFTFPSPCPTKSLLIKLFLINPFEFQSHACQGIERYPSYANSWGSIFSHCDLMDASELSLS